MWTLSLMIWRRNYGTISIYKDLKVSFVCHLQINFAIAPLAVPQQFAEKEYYIIPCFKFCRFLSIAPSQPTFK